MAIQQDIAWVRGQTEEWTLTVINNDGTPSNLSTALALEFEVKLYFGAPDPAIVHLDTASGITIRSQVGADVGVADVVVSDLVTFSLTAGTWHYDVFVTRADSARKCVMFGNLTVQDVVNFP